MTDLHSLTREQKQRLVVVYYNLNRAKQNLPDRWSIAEYKSPLCYGLVQRHAQTVTLANATFVVNQSGLQRCRDRQVRTVHAWVVGELSDDALRRDAHDVTAVSYNPYRADWFYPVGDLDTEFEGADFAFFGTDRKVHCW